MSAILAWNYPETEHDPSAIPDLSRLEERRRLSPAAARAFLSIMEHWSVRDEEARALLGGMSHGAYYQFKRIYQVKRSAAGTLKQDQLLRISYLIGIFKALNILYSETLADRWMQLPNRNPLFAGKTPLELLLTGGTPAMDLVRRLLDARRGGH